MAVQRIKPVAYSQDEWEARRPVITRLYAVEKRSLVDVSVLLSGLGFHVNTRMIKTRIQRWKLDRKHKWAEMRTAVQILADDRVRWLREAPRFSIRGQIVTWAEVVRYFRRKGIGDPLLWVEGLEEDGFVASPDVRLLTVDGSASTSSSGIESGSGAESDVEEARFVNVDVDSAISMGSAERRATNLVCLGVQHASQASSIGSRFIRPTQHQSGEKIIWCMRDYCASYLDSSRASEHREPEVHQLTTHGHFGQRMQDGISLLLRGEADTAFESFQSAFGLVSDLLLDDHPMSLALLMMIICELDRHQITPLIQKLVLYVHKMAEIRFGEQHPIITLFAQLAEAEIAVSELILCAMRRAIGYLTDHGGRLNWKTLYLKERLCDCLYHAKVDGERVAMRSNLLVEQEETYGPNARNVLWTLTNVADDHLNQEQPDKAERLFRETLKRSERLQGFGRAKTRFAALEGLAKTELVRAELARKRANVPPTSWMEERVGDDRMMILGKAVELLDMAELEARTWFEASSRRTQRVRAKKSEVLRMISAEKPAS